MNIIHRGTPPEDIVYRRTCSCGTIFEFQRSDVQNVPDPREPGYSLMCPVCHHSWFFSGFSELTKAPETPTPARRIEELRASASDRG